MIGNKRKRNCGEVQTAGFEVYHDPKMGKGLWEGISTWVMAREIFEKGRRSRPLLHWINVTPKNFVWLFQTFI